MAVSMREVDPVFQGAGQKEYPSVSSLYWSQYLYLSLPVVSFQECHVPSFFSLQFYYYFELVPAAIVSSRKSLKNL